MPNGNGSAGIEFPFLMFIEPNRVKRPACDAIFEDLGSTSTSMFTWFIITLQTNPPHFPNIQHRKLICVLDMWICGMALHKVCNTFWEKRKLQDG